MSWRTGSSLQRPASDCRDDVLQGRREPSFGGGRCRQSVSGNRRWGMTAGVSGSGHLGMRSARYE